MLKLPPELHDTIINDIYGVTLAVFDTHHLGPFTPQHAAIVTEQTKILLAKLAEV